MEGDTDTEVIAKLAMKLYDQHPTASFHELAFALIKDFQGAFSFLMKSMHYPNEIIAVKKGSQLVIGLVPRGHWQPECIDVHPKPKQLLQAPKASPSVACEPGHTENNKADSSAITSQIHNFGPAEFFLASDPSAIVRHTKRMVFLEDDDVAHIQGGCLIISKSSNVQPAVDIRDIQVVETLDGDFPSKGAFKHFMRKEILEQPEAIENALKDRLNPHTQEVIFDGLNMYIGRIRKCFRIVFIACGSSYYACLAVREIFEELNEVTVSVDVASDFLDRSVRISENAVYIFVSQSGETSDCLVALQYCQELGGLTIGIVNVVNSSIARLAHCRIYLNAGVEIGVATTKAYTSQLVVMILLALALGEHSQSMQKRREEIKHGLHLLPDHVRKVLELEHGIKSLCERALAHKSSMLVLGRGYQFPTALEAALKIKEVSYIHCEAVISGELKHGVLALVDEDLAVIMIATRDASFSRSLNGHEQRMFYRTLL